MKQLRDRWDSRLIFLFAAIGSAVGLGNLWRFPYLTYKFGGGAFLIPYLIALLLIGLPLLLLEMGLGQKNQKGAIGSLRSIGARFSGVGLLAIICGFIVVTYYAIIMAWSLIYSLGSILSPLPWTADASKFFYSNVLQLTFSPSEIGNLNLPLVISLGLVWATIYFCIFKGVRSVGKVVLFTMPLPFILLLILFFRSITLDGALIGIAYYIKPNFSLLLDPSLWLSAVSQVFFSLTLGFGVMIAYSSYNKKNQSITRNALAIILADTGLSLLAGFVVFGVLGHMAFSTGVAMDEIVKSGISLAFVVFPSALSLLPLAGFFSLVFFLTLFILGLDSAFSLVESLTTVIKDHWKRAQTHWVGLICCTIGFLFGLLFATGAGLYFLDIIDHYVSSYTLVIVGILQCIAIGWFSKIGSLRDYINSVSALKIGVWWEYSIKWVAPIALSLLVMVSLISDIRTPYEGYPLFAQLIGWGMVVIPLGIALSFSFMSKRSS